MKSRWLLIAGAFLLAGCSHPAPSRSAVYYTPPGATHDPLQTSHTSGPTIDAVTVQNAVFSSDDDFMAGACADTRDNFAGTRPYLRANDTTDILLMVPKGEHVRVARNEMRVGSLADSLDNTSYIITDDGYAGWTCSADISH